MTSTGSRAATRAARSASAGSHAAAGGFAATLRRMGWTRGLDAEAPEAGRWGPLSLVGVAVAFNLWVLRAEVLPVRQLNDSSVHQSMVQWALDRMQAGHLPFDGWYPYLGMGSSLFHHYQSLPHTLTGVLAMAVGPDWAFSGTLYVLLAAWPISVYLGARLLGWDRWSAAGAALVSPLVVSTPGYGYEHGSYTWRGLGVWSQLWGMWLLPLAWGLSWRAVAGRTKTLAIAALVVGLTAACHFITAYLALLILPLWVLIKPSEFLRRLWRGAVVGVGGLLIVSWVIVPLLSDARYNTVSQYMVGTFWDDSFGARKVFGWLVTGKLFDGSDPSRIPVISVLALLGLLVCVVRFRSDERARALIVAMGLSLFLFSGRDPFGPVIDLIPGNGDLLLHRFIMGVHMAGILMAGVGIGWIVSLVRSRTPAHAVGLARWGVVAVVAAVAVVALAPAWTERAAFDELGGTWLRNQRAADALEGANVDALIAEAQQRAPGRIFGGKFGDDNPDVVYAVPMYGYFLANDADSIGFSLRFRSMSADVEVLFDPSNPAHYDLFNVRYVLLPKGQEPAVPATLIDTKGNHSLWEVDTSGFLQVVDVIEPVTADRTNLAAQVAPWMRSALVAQGRHPAVDFAGGPPPAPTTLPSGGALRPPGEVTSEDAALEDGVVSGTVDLERPGMVMLKASFDPRWKVTVDGEELPAQMIAPSFVGRVVPAGHHTIEFRYEPYPHYALLFALGLLVFLVLLLAPRFLERRRSRSGDA